MKSGQGLAYVTFGKLRTMRGGWDLGITKHGEDGTVRTARVQH